MPNELKAANASPDFYVRRDWAVARLWETARLRSEKNRPELPLLSVFLNRGVIRYGEGGGQVHKPGLDLTVYQVVRPGDFVLNNQQAWRGSVGVSKYEGITSPAYVVLRLNESFHPRFADYLFQSRDMVAQYVTSSKGVGDIQRDLHTPWLKNLKVPMPPLDEQSAAVRLLDWRCERLDRTIRAKKKTIALLNEQKRTIIQRAITCGLDPSVSVKPSGIPWLGNIPCHWEVRPLKQILSRMDYGTSENVRTEGTIRVLTMTHIRDGRIAVPTEGGLGAIPSGLLLENHDLLFNRTNSPDLVGKVGIFTGNARDKVTFASYLVRLRTRREHNPLWLNYLLNSSGFWGFARSQALVSLHQANLNPNRYGRMLLPIPQNRAEQDQIVQYIRAKADDIERAISRLEREVELLREYRIRFVADVVTGKLDILEAVSKLPDKESNLTIEKDSDIMIGAEAIDEELAV